MKPNGLLFSCLVLTTLAGCAHTPSTGLAAVSLSEVNAQAERDCEQLHHGAQGPPVQTPIDQYRQAIAQAKQAGDEALAIRRATGLARACEQELTQRADIRALSEMLRAADKNITARDQARFEKYAAAGQYSAAISCGEGLLQGKVERCEINTTPSGPGAAGTVAGIIEIEPVGSPLAPDSPKPRSRLWPWITIGTGAALILTGGVLAGLSQKQYNDLEATCPANCPASDIKSGKNMAIATDVLFVSGGVALAAGAIWHLLIPRNEQQSATAKKDKAIGLSIGPRTIGIEGAF